MINDKAKNRLENWKFSQALRAVIEGDFDPEPEEMRIVASLADTFGDVGWFDGTMSDIVGAAVIYILLPQEDSNEERVSDQPEIPPQRGGSSAGQ